MALITLRLDDAEKGEWSRLANLRGVSLSEWIRERCNQNGKELPQPKNVPLAERSTSAPRAIDTTDEQHQREQTIARKSGHPTGCDCQAICARMRTILTPKKEK